MARVDGIMLKIAFHTLMTPLSSQNIESELSYAYLHAVASHAGASCSVGSRHEDNTGVDARLVGWGPFPNGGGVVAQMPVAAEVGSGDERDELGSG